jgi:DNA-binding NtrC family response regulator
MTKTNQSILIIDDDDYVLKSLTRVLRGGDYSISCYHDSTEALMQCSLREYDLVLSDQRMPNMQGTEFFSQLMQVCPRTRRVLISGYTDFSNVTDAFNEGLIHKFVVKPWDNDILRMLIDDELRLKAQLENSTSPDILPKQIKLDVDFDPDENLTDFHGILTCDEAVLQQISIIQRTANSDAPFFINGETGTGKEMFAKAIHLESDRAGKSFVALNCANLSETLLESQLFGHVKGAFTGAQKDQIGLLEEADKGTLFLDEVVEIPLAMQAKLLRVLQEREFTPLGKTKPQSFDVKIISAASTSLEKAVELGKFREDLRYRIEVMPIFLPPLRARNEDIRELFDYFLYQQFARHDLKFIEVDPEVYQCVLNYSWPGNIREMVNVCTYIAALSGQSDAITLQNLPPVLLALHQSSSVLPLSSGDVANDSPPLATRGISRNGLEQAILDFSGHRESIAKHFGISRMTLWRKMKQFGLHDK